jgi:hypothetical protein
MPRDSQLLLFQELAGRSLFSLRYLRQADCVMKLVRLFCIGFSERDDGSPPMRHVFLRSGIFQKSYFCREFCS